MVTKPFILHYLVITLSEYDQSLSIQLAKHLVSVGTKVGSISRSDVSFYVVISLLITPTGARPSHKHPLKIYGPVRGVFRMTSSGRMTKASVEKALAHVNETNMESLVAPVQQVKEIVADDEGDNGGRVVFSIL